MILFLLTAVPFGVFFMLFNERRQGKSFRLPSMQFFFGIIVFIPTMLLYSFLVGMATERYSGPGFYFVHLFKDHLFFLAAAVGWFFLLRNQIRTRTADDSFPAVLGFFGGFYSAVAVFDYLEQFTHLDSYVLFLLPLLRFATVILVTLCLVQFLGQYDLLKFAALAACCAIPFLIALPAVFALRHLALPTLMSAGVIGGGTAVAFLKFRDV